MDGGDWLAAYLIAAALLGLFMWALCRAADHADRRAAEWHRCAFPGCTREGRYQRLTGRTRVVEAFFCPAHGEQLGAEALDRETA